MLESDCFVSTLVRRLLRHPTDGGQKLRTLLGLSDEQPCREDGFFDVIISRNYERGYVADWRAPSPIEWCRLHTIELLKNSASPQREYILVAVVDGSDHPLGYIRLEWTLAVKSEDVSRSLSGALLSLTGRSRHSASQGHSSSDLPSHVNNARIYNERPPRDGARVVYSYTWPGAGRRPSLLTLAAIAVAIHDDERDYDPMLHPCYWHAGLLMAALVGEDVKTLHSNAAMKYPNNLEEGGGFVKAKKAGTFADLFHIVTTKDISAELARLEPALEAKEIEFAERAQAILDNIHRHIAEGRKRSPEEREEEFKRLKEGIRRRAGGCYLGQ